MPAPAGQRLTLKKRDVFLDALRSGHSVTKAAAACGLSRSTVYNHRAAEPEFAAEWDAAVEAGTDGMEDEARRRAVEGTLKPVYHQGQQVGTIREYSDTLLIFLLKGRRPGTYRDNATITHQGKDGAPLIDLASLMQRAREYRDTRDGDS